ncbi:hypothetical protein [Desulfoluna sp.]|uniref:hypothetical protein n=1 Tax=Desulfoluna sp. TaxID=2045199 RepID=UPI00261B32D5|nr:hypothetical protein [Desulfoluna sp.]
MQTLKASWDRIKAKTETCEGHKSYEETQPELIAEIQRLRRKPQNGKRLSLKKTAEALKEKGFKSSTGKDISLCLVKNIVYKTIEL